MANDWIKMRTDIYMNGRVGAIADSLLETNGLLSDYVIRNTGTECNVTRNVMRNATVGALVTVWGFARHKGIKINDDLVLSNYTERSIDDIADLAGFGSAMIQSGWLIADGSDMIFPDFFASNNVDPKEKANDVARSKAAERQQRWRENKRKSKENGDGKNGRRYVDVTETLRNGQEERESESIEEPEGNTKSKPKNDSLPEVEEKDLPTEAIIERLTYPPGFDTPDVRKAMTVWYDYRRAKKGTKTLTKPIANLNKILRDMATPDELIRGVESSILEEYTACWPDKKGSNNGNNSNGMVRPTPSRLTGPRPG